MTNHTEKNESVVVNVRIPRPWVERLDERARELGLSRSDFIRSVIPLPEQIEKVDIAVPRGEAHDKTENLVGKDMGQQSAAIAGHDVSKNNVTFPRDNKTSSTTR